MKILIYSFEAFENLEENPAFEVAKETARELNPLEVRLVCLKDNLSCFDDLKKEVKLFNPQLIIGIGVAMGRNKISIEKVALNYYRSNNKEKFEKINSSSDLAYETGFDVEKLVDHFKDDEIPVEVSLNAGSFICNFTYFNCLKEFGSEKAIFLHVPASPKEVNRLGVNTASFPIKAIAESLSKFLKKI